MVLTMINWITNERPISTGSDVSISLVNHRTRLNIRFSQGAYAVKLKNAPKVLVGIDDKKTRLYFMGSETGYKASELKNKRIIQVQANKFEDYIHPSALCGEYTMKQDADGNFYVSIGALPR